MPNDELEASCRECQDRFCNSDDRGEQFGKGFPNCVCETVSISLHSPGPVDSDEVLARLVLEPKHVRDGEIEVAALRDATSNGLSLVRRRPSDDEDLIVRGRNLAEIQNSRASERAAENNEPDPARQSFIGFVQFRAGDVRSHEVNARRSFCVFDSALAEDRLHADIVMEGPRTKAERAKLRNELRKLLLDTKPSLGSLTGRSQDR